MAEIVQMKSAGESEQQVFVTDVDRVELATQVAAIVRASFKPLTDSDIRSILQTAASQLSVSGLGQS